MPVLYDPTHPDWTAVRRIFFDWLRSDPNANQLNPTGEAYQRFVEYANNNRQPQVLAFHVTEVFWQLLVEGIVAPGVNCLLVSAVLVCMVASPRPTLGAESAPRPCEAETRALTTMKSSWPELYLAAVALPNRCFDGYFAEGISDTIVRRMGQDWAGFIAVLSAHPADERFMSVVVRSINATLDPNDIKVVAGRATSECPETLKKQCASIFEQAAEALRQ